MRHERKDAMLCRSARDGTGPRRGLPGARRRRWAAAALAALPLCGCAPGDDVGTFVPGDAPATKAAPAGASGSGERAGPQVEKVRPAPGMQVVVEWPAGLSPEHRAMIKAYRDYYTKVWGAIATGGKDDSYLETLEEPASRSGYEWVRAFAASAGAARGVVRVYDLRVSSVTGRGAQVDACVDRSGVQVTDARTGRPDAEQPDWTKPPKAVHFQAAGVRRGDDGVWRVKALRYAEQPDERARACLR